MHSGIPIKWSFWFPNAWQNGNHSTSVFEPLAILGRWKAQFHPQHSSSLHLKIDLICMWTQLPVNSLCVMASMMHLRVLIASWWNDWNQSNHDKIRVHLISCLCCVPTGFCCWLHCRSTRKTCSKGKVCRWIINFGWNFNHHVCACHAACFPIHSTVHHPCCWHDGW